jgi:hypothetical protein
MSDYPQKDGNLRLYILRYRQSAKNHEEIQKPLPYATQDDETVTRSPFLLLYMGPTNSG